MRTFIFACVHNAGRSQMSAALFNRLAHPDHARAISAGTEPGAQVHPVVIEAMREALPVFGRKIPRYDDPEALLTGVETRTSSPVRITRGADLQSLNVRGLFPAGEGAGYAGGILSAAVDGIRVAEAVARAIVEA